MISIRLRLRPRSKLSVQPALRVSTGVALAGLLAGALTAHAAATEADPRAAVPRSWVVDVARNEVAAIQYEDGYLRYRIHAIGAKGNLVRDVIESKDGTVARLIEKENRPLTPDEDMAERMRLQEMLDSPSAFQKHVKSGQSDRKLAVEMIRLMPDAMIYGYTPGQPQRPSHHGEPEIVLDYHPDPSWKPPSTTAEALTGLEGRMWVDQRTRQMTRMEGDIFRPVNFGYGVLARIFPGGKLTLEQVEAPGNRLMFSHFDEHITLRALMVKTIAENSNVESSQFQVVGTIPYQDAIRMLLATPLPK